MLLLHDKVKVSVPVVVGVSVIVPEVACEPLHAPLAVQLVPAVAVQVSVADCPNVIEVGLTVMAIAATVDPEGEW